jgi:hypothetical protein
MIERFDADGLQFQHTKTTKDFYSGDQLDWKVQFENYSPVDNYNLSLVLLHATNPKISLTASQNLAENLFEFIVPNTATNNYVAGKYLLYFILTRSSDSFVKQMEIGFITISPNIANSINLDVRTHSQKVLDSIKTLLEGKMLDDVANYTINGRTLTKLSLDELRKIKIYYENEVQVEISRKELKDNGRTTKNKLKVQVNMPWNSHNNGYPW